MSKDLIIDVNESEVTIALLDDKQLIELNKEKRTIQFTVGDIFICHVLHHVVYPWISGKWAGPGGSGYGKF